MTHVRPLPRLSLLLAAAILTACPAGVAPPGGASDATSAGLKRAGVAVGGKLIKLNAPAGAKLTDLAVVVGGRVLRPDATGFVAVPADLAATAAKSGVTVVAAGFAPVRLDAKDAEITLVAAETAAQGRSAPGGGAAVTGGGVGLTLPAGALAKADAAVTLSHYTPDADAPWLAGAASVRDALGGGACDRPLPCPPPEARVGVLVSVDAPLKPGLLQLTFDLDAWARGWDGVAPAPWLASPAEWSDAARQRALAAVRIRKTFAAIEQQGQTALRAKLANDYGLALTGATFTARLMVGAEAAASGVVRTEIWGTTVLGAMLEVTVVSAVGASLPPALGGTAPATPAPGGVPGGVTAGGLAGGGIAGGGISGGGLPAPNPVASAPPIVDPATLIGKAKDPVAYAAQIIANNSGSLCRGGGAVLAAGGNGLISDGGGGLISDAGAGILTPGGQLINAVPAGTIAGFAPNAGRIEGTVTAPFATARYQLADAGFRLASLFPTAPMVSMDMVLPYVAGSPIATTDDAGRFVMTGLPASADYVLVACRREGVTLMTIARAPRGAGEVVRADVNPDTTVAAAAALFWLADGCAPPKEFAPEGFAAAVAQIAGTLTEQEYRLAAGKLYESVPGLGGFVEDQMGVTFETRRATIAATNPNWISLGAVEAGTRVGFEASGTTFNGVVTTDWRGAPTNNLYGMLQVRAPGLPAQVVPSGRTVVIPAGGELEAWYFDGAGGYFDNSGSYDLKLYLSRCQ